MPLNYSVRIFLSIYVSVRLSVYLSFYLYVHLLMSARIYVRLFICLFDCILSCCMSIDVSIFGIFTNQEEFPFVCPGMPGYYDNYKVMAWFVNNYYGVITPEQSIKNQGRYYTNHFAITVSTYTFVLLSNHVENRIIEYHEKIRIIEDMSFVLTSFLHSFFYFISLSLLI